MSLPFSFSVSGIGLNVTAFQVFHVAYFKPLAVHDLKSLVHFYRTSKNYKLSDLPYPAAQFIRSHNDVLSAVMNRSDSEVIWGDNAANRFRGAFISANWFDELGYGPAMGRVASTKGSTSNTTRRLPLLSATTIGRSSSKEIRTS